jgi:predicted SprT family Zn-dependent metalloprotease
VNRLTAIKMAKALMDQHGLTGEGWRFVIDEQPRKRLGQCRYQRKEIGITGWYIERNDARSVQNTILHEIAHALTPGHNHDWVWRQKAIDIGCDGQRCADDKKIEVIPARWRGTCPECGTHYYRERRPRRNDFQCPKCPKREVEHVTLKGGCARREVLRVGPRFQFVPNPELIKSAAEMANEREKHGGEIARLLTELASADRTRAKSIRARLRRLGHQGGLR